jgi:hypothetical protein
LQADIAKHPIVQIVERHQIGPLLPVSNDERSELRERRPKTGEGS